MAERTLRADAARNHQRIVDAALAAFEDVGPNVTLDEIAERAELSVATLYRRFRNRDQVVRAVFDHVLSTEVEPVAAAHTDDPWHDLTGLLATAVESLARHRGLLAAARETHAFDVDSVQRCANSLQQMLQRATAAGAVRPELEVRDLAAVIVMTLSTVHPDDPGGVDRRRYLALLLDGIRPSRETLPPPSTHEVPGTRG
ncbi:TetR/AcrR family transcriptional regulator [Saccharopolyspora rhizosphaerae]|uniref:TetR/AcrR family transcriptional regulator n=1 Tax=Saccharopolyspora rhizosphaerae TaxID=2492662 RepID=A0A3R8P146_9PSEU|nr:TetR/AcrR family transcriptional regulator [Saccharopolyspora rhizosphaerae]RRO14231.1 TetR/AcrR family transcriptional regulator [Saccharopolyspora rhizosphaerae]